MCQSCGCSPCKVCGGPIEDGVCIGCGNRPADCTCEPDFDDYEDNEDYD